MTNPCDSEVIPTTLGAITFSNFDNLRALYSDDIMEFSIEENALNVNYSVLLYYDQDAWFDWIGFVQNSCQNVADAE